MSEDNSARELLVKPNGPIQSIRTSVLLYHKVHGQLIPKIGLNGSNIDIMRVYTYLHYHTLRTGSTIGQNYATIGGL
jgi:hypothetical protein